MKIKIIVGDKRNVDFETPIGVNNTEKEQFFQLMEDLFEPVEKEEVKGFRTWRIGGDRIQYPREWTSREYEVLLKSHTLEEAIDKLGRSGMAVIVQDGKWRPEFFSWCYSKGKNPFEGNIIQIVKEFMKEQKDKILVSRNKKKQIQRKKKEIKELEKKLKWLDSEKAKNQIDLWIRLKQLHTESAQPYIQKEKEKIKEMINKLKKIKEIE